MSKRLKYNKLTIEYVEAKTLQDIMPIEYEAKLAMNLSNKVVEVNTVDCLTLNAKQSRLLAQWLIHSADTLEN